MAVKCPFIVAVFLGVKASKILEQLQIDHTGIDLIVVDERERQPIGRPCLTVAIDVYSR